MKMTEEEYTEYYLKKTSYTELILIKDKRLTHSAACLLRLLQNSCIERDILFFKNKQFAEILNRNIKTIEKALQLLKKLKYIRVVTKKIGCKPNRKIILRKDLVIKSN